jgi:hypothetical protein
MDKDEDFIVTVGIPIAVLVWALASTQVHEVAKIG